MTCPIPQNEEERLAALARVGLLDTARDPRFDALCREAAARFRAPVALISLMDRDRQWFKAACGLGIEGTSRSVAFCAHTVMSDRVMVVPDARSDPRFADNPLVTGWPHIVFYAGAPLVYGRSIRLGTLCVIDTVPRDFGPADEADLAEIADRVSGEIWAFASDRAEVA